MSSRPTTGSQPGGDARFTAVRTLRLDGIGWTAIGEQLKLGLTREGVRQLWLRHATPDDLQAAAHAVAQRQRAAAETLTRQREQRHARQAARRSDARQRVIEAIHDWHEHFGEPPGASDWHTTQARTLSGGWRWQRYQSTGRRWPHASVVQRMFGSWNAAIAAAGFPPRKWAPTRAALKRHPTRARRTP